jgi:hypothetical protein
MEILYFNIALFVTGAWIARRPGTGVAGGTATGGKMDTEFLCGLAARRLPIRFDAVEDVAVVRELIEEGYVLGIASREEVEEPFATVLMLTRSAQQAIHDRQGLQHGLH